MTSYISCTLALLPIFGIGTFKTVIFCAVLKCVRLGTKGHIYTKVGGWKSQGIRNVSKSNPEFMLKV
jgi:hypothetical protein